MRKEYRIKERIEDYSTMSCVVQVRSWWGGWIDVKTFYDPHDYAFARLEAEELIEKLSE